MVADVLILTRQWTRYRNDGFRMEIPLWPYRIPQVYIYMYTCPDSKDPRIDID